MYNYDLDKEIKGSTVVKCEWHPSTGELLTLYLKSPNGVFIRVVPVSYALRYSEAYENITPKNEKNS